MYEKSKKGWVKHWDFVLLDIISLEVSFAVAYLIRFGNLKIFSGESDKNIFFLAPIIDFVLLTLFERFSSVLRRKKWIEFTQTVKHVLFYFCFLTLILFSFKISHNFSRIFLYIYIIVYFVLSFTTRLLYKKHLQNTKGKSANKSIILVSNKDDIDSLLTKINENNYQGYSICAIELDGYPEDKINGIPVLKDSEAMMAFALENWVDEIFFDLHFGENVPEDLLIRLETMGITIHISCPVPVDYGYKVIAENFSKIPVLTITTNIMTAKQSVEKRLLDIAGGLAGSFITLILIIFIGPIIKIKSPGPIFFKQTRIGRNGKPFKMIKFRSMYMDAEERKKELMAQNRIKDGMMFKMEFDPRVIGNYIDENGNRHTGIGEFIRKYSLDEFPQFFNVLAGDMSLVGTRPPTEDEVAKYSEHHKARLAIKPGITGMWQISGRSEIVDFEEVVKLDTEYINNWNLGLDIKILLKTVKAVFNKEGAM